ncbi:MAG: cellulase family glycosylhydrolase [Actinomycetota bacterium]
MGRAEQRQLTRLAIAALCVAALAATTLARGTPVCDALCLRVRSELAVFTDWLERHGVLGYIGEVGWPDDSRGDADEWNALADYWYRDADAARLPVTAWATGEWWGTDYKLASYEDRESPDGVETADDQASVIESHTTTSSYRRGVNVAGAEFAGPVDEPTSLFSNASPGEDGTDYHYEPQSTFDFLVSRGIKIVRVPFRWERIQPVLGSPLDAAELKRLSDAVARARGAGLQVVLDLHNYGAYYRFDGSKGIRRGLGSAQLTKFHFVDVWRRLSSHFKNNSGVYAYGLMNEPTGMGESAGLSPARRWEIISQAAVDAIRANGDGKTVMVAGYDWSGVRQWMTQHPSPWISDPTGRLRYEAHHYWDRDNSGDYPDSYAAEVAAAEQLQQVD